MLSVDIKQFSKESFELVNRHWKDIEALTATASVMTGLSEEKYLKRLTVIIGVAYTLGYKKAYEER